MHAGLYRVMAQDGVQLNQVNTKNGDTSVLNLKVVKYWTPDDKGNPWHKVTLWGEQAERYVNHIEHNQALYIEGDLEFETYSKTYELADGSEKTIVKNDPAFRRINEFRVVNVVPTPRNQDGDSSNDGDDPVAAKATKAAKSKTTKSTGDQVPF